MGDTKKVKSAGRFGSRYGVGIRKRILKVESRQHSKHTCPYCGFGKIKREAPGIFSCRKCGKRFTGGAYVPVTMSGSIVSKMVTQKRISSSAREHGGTGYAEELHKGASGTANVAEGADVADAKSEKVQAVDTVSGKKKPKIPKKNKTVPKERSKKSGKAKGKKGV